MRPDLRRINEALHQLADRPSPEVSSPLAAPVSATAPGEEPLTGKATFQPTIALPTLPILNSERVTQSRATLPEGSTERPTTFRTEAIVQATRTRATGNSESLVPPETGLNYSLSLSGDHSKVPSLPRVKTPSLSSHRNGENPSLAMSLLKEMETTVASWQEELQQVLRQVQDLYLEGPIVDGWLESYAQQEGEAPAFRHADVDCLMDYIEKMREASISDLPQPAIPDHLPPISPDLVAAGYRLCGLNEDGQLWFRHCPPEQVPSVSLAIARYQRLRILLSRKQCLELRLSQLAQTLIGLHGQWNGD